MGTGERNISWRGVRGPLWPRCFLHRTSPTRVLWKADEVTQTNVRTGLFTHNSETLLCIQYIFILHLHCARHWIRYSVSSQRAPCVVRGWKAFRVLNLSRGGCRVRGKACGCPGSFQGEAALNWNLRPNRYSSQGVEMHVKAQEGIGCSENHRRSNQQVKSDHVEGRKRALVNYNNNKSYILTELFICSKHCTTFFIYGVLVNFHRNPMRCRYYPVHFTEISSKWNNLPQDAHLFSGSMGIWTQIFLITGPRKNVYIIFSGVLWERAEIDSHSEWLK